MARRDNYFVSSRMRDCNHLRYDIHTADRTFPSKINPMKINKRTHTRIAVLIALALGLLHLGHAPALAETEDTKAEKKTDPETKVIHHLTLRGLYSERPSGMSLDLTSLVMGGGLGSKSYFKLADHIDGLAKAGEVDAFVLDLSQPFSLGRVNIHDFCRRIAGLKEAGIRTFAWVGSMDTPVLCVASMCDEIYMAKDGMVDIPSATMSHTFFKDLFNLLGVNVTAIRAGDFKGAVEPYTRASMSVHLRKHYEKLLTSMNDASVAQIAAGRKLSSEVVRQLQQNRLMQPAAAQKNGLLDKLVDPGRMRESVAKAVGGTVEWTEPKKPKPKSFGLSDIFKALAGGGNKTAKQIKPTVVVFHLNGEIVDGHKPSSGQIVDGPTVKALDDLRGDEQVKAVVVRIDSPGGSATASENIRVALDKLAEQKPVVFSMAGVAASGGYLVACLDAPIFADADTITGSIGVFGMSIEFDSLLRRVGVNMETVAIDEAARQLQLGKPWSDEELAKLQVHVDATYDLFLNRVSQARGVPVEKLKSLAGGRVWTGAQAKALGLVDHLGGLHASLKAVRAKAKLGVDEEVEIKHLPKARTGLDLSGLLGDDDEVIFTDLPRQLAKLNALGIDTRSIEFLLRHARPSKTEPKVMKTWMLHPMNFRIR